MFPAVYFYRKDRIGRLIGGLTSVEEQRLSIPEMLLLLAAGAGFAQYANVPDLPSMPMCWWRSCRTGSHPAMERR